MMMNGQKHVSRQLVNRRLQRGSKEVRNFGDLHNANTSSWRKLMLVRYKLRS